MGDKYDDLLDGGGAPDKYDALLDGGGPSSGGMSEQQFHSLGFTEKIKATWNETSPFSGKEAVDPTFDNGVFRAVGAAGKFATEKINQAAGYAAEKLGTPGVIAGGVAATAADLMIPQDKESAGLAFLSGLAGRAGAAGQRKDLAPLGNRGMGPVDRTRVAQPNALENLAGGAISVTSRVPQRFASSVVADPSILADETPDVAAVGKMMNEYFAKKGVSLNSEKLAEISGKGYFPNDNQVETLRKTLLDPVLEKIQQGGVPSEEELIFAERAAGAIKRSNSAQVNKYVMSYANGAQSMLLDTLEKSGFSELPGLKAMYFRALAKDAFSDFLPKNKVGSPNALSALLMGQQMTGAVGDLAQGNIAGAAGKAVTAASFSPLLVGQAIRGLNPSVREPLVRAGAMAASPLAKYYESSRRQ